VPENPRIEELRRRVQADPASIAFAGLAEEFRRVGRFEDAIETCRQGLQRHPAYLSARVTLGRALIEVGDDDAARTELELVLQSAPENLVALRGLEQIRERQQHSTELHPDLHVLVKEGEALRQEEEETRQRDEESRRQEQEEERRRQGEQTRRLEREARRREEERRRQEEDAKRVAETPVASVPDELNDELNLDSLEISLDMPVPPAPASVSTTEPLDVFAAALERTPLPAPAPSSDPQVVFDTEPDAAPDPHVAATLGRLEQFLGAIQTARRA
jgi:tetratricopeptide (TPR) repeat protein